MALMILSNIQSKEPYKTAHIIRELPLASHPSPSHLFIITLSRSSLSRAGVQFSEKEKNDLRGKDEGISNVTCCWQVTVCTE